MDQILSRILQKVSENPDYQSITNYLRSRSATPQVLINPQATSTHGTFTAPLFGNPNIPPAGVVRLNNYANYSNPSDIAPTVLHEMTHATQMQLVNQYNELKQKPNKTDLEKQFMGNFEKIIGEQGSMINPQIAKFSPKFAEKQAGYRASGDEALAFALENSNYKNPPDKSYAPPHVDPSFATELMLLLDQAQRVQNQQIPPQGR
jgi:hypothetical protein